MKLNLTLRHKAMIPMILVLICEIVFGITMAWLIAEAENQLEQEHHARQVISHLQKFLSDQQSLPFYLLREIALPGEIGAAEAERCLADTREDLSEIKKLVAGVPSQMETVHKLDAGLERSSDLIAQCRTAPVWRKEPVLKIMFYARKLNELTRESVDDANRLLGSYKDFEAAGLKRQRHLRFQVTAWLMVGIVLNVVLAVSLSIGFTRNIVSRLEKMATNAYRLAAGVPLEPPVGGSDEIADVDMRFHAMAKSLSDMTQRERAVIENALDFICSIDRQDRFVAVNPACRGLFGYEQDELMGRHYIDIVADSSRKETQATLAGCAERHGDAIFESQILRKDGAAVVVLWAAHWSPDEEALFCVVHDISERKRAEELVKSILQHQPVGVITISETGVIESINRRIEQIFQLPATDLIGSVAAPLFEQPNNEQFDLLRESLQSAPGAVLECFGKRGTGELFPVEVTFNRLTALDETRLLVNVQDITERREIERLREEFFNMVSHDLRSPITAVHAIITMLIEGIIDVSTERGRDRLQDAKIATERVIDLVTELLDLDRSRAGKLILDLEEVQLSAIARRSMETLELFAQQQGVKLVNSTIEAVVLAEEGRLAQVLTNLMSNAIKFSPAGTTVEILSTFDEGMCKVMVRDQGPGVPKEMCETIFERFKQLPTKQARSGSGLGLAFCKEIVKCHNGTIGVESEVGKGSIFWFTVPLAPATVTKPPEVAQKTK